MIPGELIPQHNLNALEIPNKHCPTICGRFGRAMAACTPCTCLKKEHTMTNIFHAMPAKREFEEIEVDIAAPKPLNKKQKRLLKKGKIEAPQPEDPTKPQGPKPRSEHAVWIGNLSYETTADAIRNFIIEKTASKSEPIVSEDILRIKLPPKKGFAYVDLKSADQVAMAIELSESRLDNRNLLIKSAGSFEGRPESHVLGQKNPPSRILFVGNLPFDSTDEQLQEQFQHCGEIVKIRTATFEDTGKCKGFSFIDFKSEEGPTNALKDPKCRRMNGRNLRMEYGEDRSQRRPQREQRAEYSSESAHPRSETRVEASSAPSDTRSYRSEPRERSTHEQRPREQRPRERRPARPTPGAALSGAQRAKHTIIPSAGKKVTFD